MAPLVAVSVNWIVEHIITPDTGGSNNSEVTAVNSHIYSIVYRTLHWYSHGSILQHCSFAAT